MKLADDLHPSKGSEAEFGPVPSSIWSRWVERRFPVYGRALIVVLAFLLPVAIGPGLGDSVSLVKLTLVLWFVSVSVGLLSVLVVHGRVRPLSLRPTGLALVVGALIVVSGASAIGSTAPRLSIMGLPTRYGGLVTLLCGITIASLVVGFFRHDESRLNSIVLAMVWSSAAMSLYVIVQAAGLDPLHWLDAAGRPVPYPVGTMGNSNFAGAYLAITLPLALYVVLSRQTIAGKVAWGLLCSVQLLALWYTQTRAGFLAAGVSVLIVAAFGISRKEARKSTLIRRVGVVGLGIAVGVAVYSMGPGSMGGAGPLSNSRTQTLSNRFVFWNAAVDIAVDNPLLGTGPDTFYATYMPHRSKAEAEYDGLSLPEEPHNIFLERAANFGLLALGLYVSIMLIVIVRVVRILRSRRGGDLSLVALLAALVAYLVQGFFSIDAVPLAIVGWLLLGCILVRCHSTISPVNSPGVAAVESFDISHDLRPRAGWKERVAVVAVAIVAIGAATIGSVPLLAAMRGRANLLQAVRFYATSDDLTRACHVEWNIATASHRAPVAQSHYRAASKHCLRAAEIRPKSVIIERDLARLNTEWGQRADPHRFVAADLWWRRALALDPFDPRLQADRKAALLQMVAAGDAFLERARIGGAESSMASLGAAEAYWAGEQPDRAREAAILAISIDPSNTLAEAFLQTGRPR